MFPFGEKRMMSIYNLRNILEYHNYKNSETNYLYISDNFGVFIRPNIYSGYKDLQVGDIAECLWIGVNCENFCTHLKVDFEVNKIYRSIMDNKETQENFLRGIKPKMQCNNTLTSKDYLNIYSCMIELKRIIPDFETYKIY